MGMTVGTSKSKTGWFLNLQSFFHSDINTVDLKSQENAKIIMKCYEKFSVLKTYPQILEAAKLYATIYLKMQPVSFFFLQFQTTKNKITEQFAATEFICATPQNSFCPTQDRGANHRPASRCITPLCLHCKRPLVAFWQRLWHLVCFHCSDTKQTTTLQTHCGTNLSSQIPLKLTRSWNFLLFLNNQIWRGHVILLVFDVVHFPTNSKRVQCEQSVPVSLSFLL